MYIRQSTASQEILLGPFLDDTDGKTAETALTIANTDIKIWKHGATTEASKNSGGATHIAAGRYYAVLDATDTDTLGLMEVNVHVSGALPVRRAYVVLPAVVFDALVLGTDNLDVSTVQLAGQSVTAASGVTFPSSVASPTNITSASGITLAAATHTGAVIPTVTTVTNQLTAAQIATGVWQDATAGDFTAASSIGKSLYTSGAVPGAAGGLFIAGTNAATTITTALTTTFTGNLTGSVGSVTGAVGSVTGNVGGNVTGSVGSVASGGITTASFAAGAINAAAIAADAIGASELATDAVAEIADAVWDEVLSGHLTATTTGAALNAAGSAGDPWSTALPGAYGAGTAGYLVGIYLDGAVTSRLAPTVAGRTLDVSATGEAGVDWANVGGATTTLNLSGTTISTSQAVASVSGAVGSVGSGGITAASIAADALTAAKFAADVTTEFQSGLATAAALATVAGYVDTEVAAIKAKTDLIPASPASVGDVPTVDDIWAKAMAELSAVPGVAGTVLEALSWCFTVSRNKLTQTSTTQTVFKDDGSTALATSTVADDGSVFTRNEFS